MPVQAARRRTMPCAGALQRCYDAALGARHRRRRGVLGGVLPVVSQFEKFVIPAHAGTLVNQLVKIPAFVGMT